MSILLIKSALYQGSEAFQLHSNQAGAERKTLISTIVANGKQIPESMAQRAEYDIFVRMFKASSSNNLRGLIGWLALAFVAAAIGGLGSANAPDFYGQLTLPDWAPPAWLFGPVWSLLYLMMGIASWLVWRKGGFNGARAALILYLVQLALNTLWSWLFFAWQSGLLAFVEILILWVLIVSTLIAFYRISRPAALLLVPYLLWVSFASALAWNSWQMNPALLG